MIQRQPMRQEVIERHRQRPFVPFILNLKSGERIFVEQPENMAYRPDRPNNNSLIVASRRSRYTGTFTAIASITMILPGSEEIV